LVTTKEENRNGWDYKKECFKHRENKVKYIEDKES
jgi:hypothetical protein